jgi:hypothetical protein
MTSHPPPENRFERRDILFLSAGFLVVRAIVYALGVRLDTVGILYYSQFLDTPLLHQDLLKSLWFLHAQPPLFNLITGLALKVSVAHCQEVLQVFFVLMGYLSCLALAGSLRGFGLQRGLSMACALVFTSMPGFIAYENLYFYPHLSQTLILLSGYCFMRSKSRSIKWFCGALWWLVALVFLRSLFHPVFLGIVIVALFFFIKKPFRKSFLLHMSTPLFLVCVLLLKNYFLFGFIGTSSWGGNSFHRIVTAKTETRVLQEWVDAGELSSISLLWEFSHPQEYLDVLKAEEKPTGVPVLDMLDKEAATVNSANYNHWVYPQASDAYRKNAWWILTRHPGEYLRALADTSLMFFDPVTRNGFLLNNREILGPSLDLEEKTTDTLLYFLFLMGFLPASIWFCQVSIRNHKPESVFLLFHLGIVLWVMALGIGAEYGENNRFRYQCMGSWWLLIAYASWRISHALREKVRSSRTWKTPSSKKGAHADFEDEKR